MPKFIVNYVRVVDYVSTRVGRLERRAVRAAEEAEPARAPRSGAAPHRVWGHDHDEGKVGS